MYVTKKRKEEEKSDNSSDDHNVNPKVDVCTFLVYCIFGGKQAAPMPSDWEKHRLEYGAMAGQMKCYNPKDRINIGDSISYPTKYQGIDGIYSVVDEKSAISFVFYMRALHPETTFVVAPVGGVIKTLHSNN